MAKLLKLSLLQTFTSAALGNKCVRQGDVIRVRDDMAEKLSKLEGMNRSDEYEPYFVDAAPDARVTHDFCPDEPVAVVEPVAVQEPAPEVAEEAQPEPVAEAAPEEPAPEPVVEKPVAKKAPQRKARATKAS